MLNSSKRSNLPRYGSNDGSLCDEFLFDSEGGLGLTDTDGADCGLSGNLVVAASSLPLNFVANLFLARNLGYRFELGFVGFAIALYLS